MKITRDQLFTYLNVLKSHEEEIRCLYCDIIKRTDFYSDCIRQFVFYGITRPNDTKTPLASAIHWLYYFGEFDKFADLVIEGIMKVYDEYRRDNSSY